MRGRRERKGGEERDRESEKEETEGGERGGEGRGGEGEGERDRERERERGQRETGGGEGYSPNIDKLFQKYAHKLHYTTLYIDRAYIVPFHHIPPPPPHFRCFLYSIHRHGRFVVIYYNNSSSLEEDH